MLIQNNRLDLALQAKILGSAPNVRVESSSSW